MKDSFHPEHHLDTHSDRLANFVDILRMDQMNTHMDVHCGNRVLLSSRITSWLADSKQRDPDFRERDTRKYHDTDIAPADFIIGSPCFFGIGHLAIGVQSTPHSRRFCLKPMDPVQMQVSEKETPHRSEICVTLSNSSTDSCRVPVDRQKYRCSDCRVVRTHPALALLHYSALAEIGPTPDRAQVFVYRIYHTVGI